MSVPRPDRVESTLTTAYSWGTWLLARDLREAHGADMTQAFNDGLVASRGAAWRRARFVTHSFAGLLAAGVTGRLEGWSQRGRHGSAHPRTHANGTGGREMVGHVWQDIRLAIRANLRRPAFAISTVLITALGLGAATTIFSVVDGVMLRGLPYPSAERLVFFENGSHSAPRFLDWRERLTSFETLAAALGTELSLSGEDTPERLSGVLVTEGFLRSLGAQPTEGRLFTRDEFSSGVAVAIISQGLSEQTFGREVDALGRTVVLDGEPTVIVGVLGHRFVEPVGVVEGGVDVWLPLDLRHPALANPRMFVLDVIGLLRETVSMEAARRELSVAASELAASRPEVHGSVDGAEIAIVPLQDAIVGDVASTLNLLLGAVVVLLLIACSNVANLFLARGTAHVRDVAVRRAIGATHGRVVSQLLTESVVLSLLGGALGCGLAYLAVEAFQAWGPTDFPRLMTLAVDRRVLFVAFGASLLTGVLFGLAPAVRGIGADVNGIIKDTSASLSATRSGHRLRTGLVIGEIALTLMLLVGAGLLMNSFVRVTRVDPGFDSDQLVIVPLNLSDYSGGERLQFVNEVHDRVLGLPGVDAAALALNAPFVRYGSSRCCWATFDVTSDDGRPGPELTVMDWVTPGFFSTLGVEVRGRNLQPADAGVVPSPTVVSGALAAALFPGEEAVGRSFTDDEDDEFRVVGVVSGLHYWGLDQGAEEHMWLLHEPFANMGGTGSMVLLVRTGRDAGAMASALREAIWAVEPNLPIEEVTTMHQRMSASTAPARFQSLLFMTFATVSLLLAAAGIYGSTLYVVSQRRREFGIRVVLGARGGDVVGLVLRRGLLHALVGISIGTVGALLLGGFLESWLFGITSTDPLTILAVGLLLGFVVVLASWLPARRAATASPVETLSAE